MKRLGGIGGQVFSAPVCGLYGGALGGLAYSPPFLFVPCNDGIVALETKLESNPSFTVVWRGPNFVSGPPVVAGNAVWTLDINRGLLYAFGLRDGQILFKDTVGYTVHFTTPSVGRRPNLRFRKPPDALIPSHTIRNCRILVSVEWGSFRCVCVCGNSCVHAKTAAGDGSNCDGRTTRRSLDGMFSITLYLLYF